MKDRSIAVIVALAGLAAVAVFYGSVHWHQTLDIKLGTEVFKATYEYLVQFLLIVVLGGFVTYFYTVSAKEREQEAATLAKEKEQQAAERAKEKDKEDARRNARYELRKKFYEDFTQTINEAVKILMLLGAEAVQQGEVYKEQYSQLMQRFLEVYVGVGSLSDRVESYRKLFEPKDAALTTNFEEMINYLFGVVKEYNNYRDYFKDRAKIPRSELKALDEFLNLGFDKVRPQEDSAFMKGFKKPNDKIRGALQELLASST